MAREDKKTQLLELKLKDLANYRNVKECSRDLGYSAHGQVGERIRELDLGMDLADLGLSVLNKSTRVISPSEFEILKESLLNKRKAGRKPGLLSTKKEGDKK